MKCNRLWEYMKCMLLQRVRDSISTFTDNIKCFCSEAEAAPLPGAGSEAEAAPLPGAARAGGLRPC